MEIDPNYNSAHSYKGIAFQKLGKDDDTRNRYFYLQHRDSDTTEKYEYGIIKFDGTYKKQGNLVQHLIHNKAGLAQY